MELKNCTLSSSESQNSGEILCEHKDTGQPPFAHGLCRSCFEDVTFLNHQQFVSGVWFTVFDWCSLLQFIELSGGLDGGSDPPAFQLAERKREAEESAKKSDEHDVDILPQNENETTENETTENMNETVGCWFPQKFVSCVFYQLTF